MSLLRNFFVPKREVAVKLPSHKLGSAGTLALYGVIMGGEGSVDVTVSLVEVGLRVSSLETHGGLEGSNVKLYIGRFDGGDMKCLCHKLHPAISPPILRQFSWSQWLQKALEKTF